MNSSWIDAILLIQELCYIFFMLMSFMLWRNEQHLFCLIFAFSKFLARVSLVLVNMLVYRSVGIN
jgi:hypothetical protein